MKKLFFLVFFISSTGFAQNLENDIYSATEAFIANQNATAYITLNKKADQFRNQLKTKDDQLAFVFLLCNKAYYLRYKIPTQAITDYEDAWSRYTRYELSTLSDFDIIENCLKPLGNLYIKNGDYTNAENIIKHYIFLAEQQQDKTQQVAGAINLSKLFQTLNKHETVVAVVDKALKIPNINSEQKQKLISIKNTSLIASGKMDSKRWNENDIVLSGSYNSSEIAYQLALKNKDYKKALSHFHYKKIFLEKDTLSNITKAKLDVEEAQIHFKLNNFKAASQKLKNALHILIPNFDGKGLPEKTQLYAENTFVAIFDLLALLQPNTEQALKCYNLSVFVSDLMYKTLTSQQSKIENLASSRLRSEKCIDLFYSEYMTSKNNDYLLQALNYAETSKARVLKEIYIKKSLIDQFPNDSLLITEQQLLKEQERITNLLISEQLGSAKAENINELGKKLNLISIELKQIKNKILEKYPDVNNDGFNLEKVIQKLENDNATLVEYFYGNNAIYHFVISPNSSSFKKIELNDQTKNAIIAFNNLFENASTINNNIADYTEQANNVFNLLNLKEITTENLIVIPDGLLNFIPFEALLTDKTTSTNYDTMPFLINKHKVLYNSSIAFYDKENTTNEKPNVLGIFPVFDGTNQKLTYSLDEANYIDDEVNATLFLNEDATKTNFLKNASNYNTLHLSTHAKAGNFSNPASISFFDDSMTINELYSLDLNSNLVVLSACETGVGKVYKSEGAMSIARGFQYAGANNVLFTLWPINDLSTSQLMQSFYQSYGKHQSGYLANYESKIKYLNNPDISNSKKSPYYWSAFVYYGQLVHPKERNYSFYYLIGLLIVGIVVFSILKKNQHG